MSDKGYSILTGDKIKIFQLHTIRHGLKLELMGMRHSSNAVFRAAKEITGESTRRKALEKIECMIKELSVTSGH